MNLSGVTLAKLLARYPLDSSTLYYLIYDHMDFQEGRIQIRLGGSHAGHKGVQSCQQILGGKKRDEIWQIRVGVGRPHASVGPLFALSSDGTG
jgi:PTH1 family peptidyl-tRNA hydrolase